MPGWASTVKEVRAPDPRTFQIVRLFGEMTVLDNVLVGCHLRGRAGWAACALRTPAMRDEERRLRERAEAVLAIVGLEERAMAGLG
jgi:branched-chain amino acid transport system ATP-binding protein